MHLFSKEKARQGLEKESWLTWLWLLYLYYHLLDPYWFVWASGFVHKILTLSSKRVKLEETEFLMCFFQEKLCFIHFILSRECFQRKKEREWECGISDFRTFPSNENCWLLVVDLELQKKITCSLCLLHKLCLKVNAPLYYIFITG